MDQQPNFRTFLYGFGINSTILRNQLIADCPFCGKEKHFYVYIGPKTPKKSAGMFNCKVCGATGNHYTFLSKICEVSSSSKSSYSELSKSRGIKEATLRFFKLSQSVVNADWLIPNYSLKKSINNVYRYAKFDGKKQIRSSSYPCTQQLYNLQTLKKSTQVVWLCEGHWDAMVLTEIFAHLAERNGKFILKGNPNFKSELFNSNCIIAVPGANTFKEEWLKHLKGKEVILLFDNDKAGSDGMASLVRKIRDDDINVKSIRKLTWKDEDPNDLRDLLGTMNHLKVFNKILECLELVDADQEVVSSTSEHGYMEPEECTSFDDQRTSKPALLSYYDKQLHMTDDIRSTLATMLSVIISTKIAGGQLALRVLGPPGAVKSTLAECVSQNQKYVHAVSRFTGIVSGFGTVSESKQMVNEINGKCLVIKEADTILQLPNRKQVESELRDALGDGVIRVRYRNKSKTQVYVTRFTAILCGTRVLRDMDDAMLGSRFLDIVVHQDDAPNEEMVDMAVATQFSAMNESLAGGNHDVGLKKLVPFLAPPTIGFIEHKLELMAKGIKIEDLTSQQDKKHKALGQFVAACRSRVPRNREGGIRYRPEKEIATRISEYLARFIYFLTIVYYNPKGDSKSLTVTNKVMDAVAKIARDTAYGFQEEIVVALSKSKGGMTKESISTLIDLQPTQTYSVLQDMKELKLVTTNARKFASGKGRNAHFFILTDYMKQIVKDCDL